MRGALQRDPNRCNPRPGGRVLTPTRHTETNGGGIALYRTAYLLAGDHVGAEDLLQNAFAELYLSWDKIRDREALDGYGSPTVSVLDGSTGEEIVTLEVALPRRTVGGFWSQMAWEGDEALVVRVFRGEEYDMMRLGLDGTVRLIDLDSAGASGLTVAEPW